MSGSYLLHPQIPINGTALLPQLPEKAENGQNKAQGLILSFLCRVKGPFIITTPGIFGVTIETEGNNPKK